MPLIQRIRLPEMLITVTYIFIAALYIENLNKIFGKCHSQYDYIEKYEFFEIVTKTNILHKIQKEIVESL